MSHAALFEAIQGDWTEAALIMLAEDPALCVEADEPSALMQAIYHHQQAVVDILIRRRRRLTVFEAAALGDLAALRLEIATYKDSPRVFAADGFTALHLACFFGQAQAAHALLQAGAGVGAIAGNASMVQPLHSAATNGDVEICRMLLDAGADPNARQHGGYTALHAAAMRANVKLAQLLLARGAELQLAAEDGRTPLDIARRASSPDAGSTLNT